MLLTNQTTRNVERKFSKVVESAENVSIASGYFGYEIIDKYYDVFVKKVSNGGKVKLLNGLAAWEGIPYKQEKILKQLDTDLSAKSGASGVFYRRLQRYHGKMYLFESEKKFCCILGSSNFSPSGFGTNLEANLYHESNEISEQVDDYINYLLSESFRPHEIQLPKRGKSQKSIKIIEEAKTTDIKLPKGFQNNKHDFEIPIRHLPRSSLNLTFGRGSV